MAENPYAIPIEELLRTSRVPVAEQVVEQPWAVAPPDWSAGTVGCDGAPADCDGGGDGG